MTERCAADYHVHSANSGDAEDRISVICHRAVEIGLTEIAFTEHLDFEPTDSCYGKFDYSRYMDEIAAARAEFDGRLTIHAGIECDYQDRFRSQIEDYLSRKKFDFVLGGVHYVDGLILEDHKAYFPGRSEREAYDPYFRVVKSAANSRLFDAIAHVDLCKRYGCLYYGRFFALAYAGILEEILSSVIVNGLALEINASGLRQAPVETYPSPNVVEMYARLGGTKIVIGSDAHRADDLGVGLAEAAKIAFEVGLAQPTGIDALRRLAPSANQGAEDGDVVAPRG